MDDRLEEHDLEALFRDAPGAPPPPTFSLEDVTKASARATARRRTTVLVTAACLVAVLCAAGIAGVSYFRSTGPSTGQPVAAPARPSQTSPGPTPLQGSGGNGKDGPRAEGTSGCEKVDRELATALAGELPATGTAGPEPGQVCATGTRSVGFHVTQGNQSGFLSVTVFPAGVKVALPTLTPGTVPAQQRTASGATLVLLAVPDAGSTAPFGDDLPHLASALAARF